ncbi:sulfotransferase family protein [Pelomyxa schiedti]|nr:sulfotransferase family protein [Pelomyxa schiedti]
MRQGAQSEGDNDNGDGAEIEVSAVHKATGCGVADTRVIQHGSTVQIFGGNEAGGGPYLPHERPAVSWVGWGVDWLGWSLGRFSPFYIDVDGILAKAKELSRYKGVAGDLSPCFKSYSLFLRGIDQNRMPATARAMLNGNFNTFVDSALSLTRYYTAHPEVGTVPMKPSIIIAGFPRTGTTLLQNLLLCDTKSRGAYTFEMCFGVPMVPPAKSPDELKNDPRIDIMSREMLKPESIFPGRRLRISESHKMGPTTRDEETFIMTLTGQWLTLFSTGCEESINDFVDPNKLHAYQFLRTFFQMLETGFAPTSHWVMKCPAHSLWLDSLAPCFPDGKIVFTHRHPTETIPSLCALFESMGGHCFYPGAWDRRILGRITKNVWKQAASRICEFQRRTDPSLYYNLQYDDLVQHPSEACRSLYNHFGLEFDEELAQRMKEWQQVNPQGQHGRRCYSLEMFGLTHKEVCDDFSEYIHTFCSRHGTPSSPPATTCTTATTSATKKDEQQTMASSSAPPQHASDRETNPQGDDDKSHKSTAAGEATPTMTSASSSSSASVSVVTTTTTKASSEGREFNVHLPHERATQSWVGWGIDWIGWSLGRFSPFYIDIPGILAKAKELSKYNGVAGDLSPCYKSYSLFLNGLDQNKIPPSSRIMLNGTLNSFVDSALSLTRYYTAHPEIGTVPLKPAIIVAGFPRTGTTLLQNFLLCDPKSRGAYTYEMFFGAPMVPPAKSPEALKTDPRIAIVDKALAQAELLYPGRSARISESHPMGTTVQDEDTFIMSLTGNWLTHYSIGDEASINDFADPNKLHTYNFLRTFFQMLETGFAPASHWILKSPSHPLWLESLANGFPSGRIVFTHRHPVETVPSLCALIESMGGHCFYPGAWDRRHLGRVTKNVWKLAAARICEFQRNVDPSLYFNVDYLDLMKRPIECCRAIYQHFGLTFDEELAQRMKDWKQANPQGKHGRRGYSLEMYGLSHKEICDDFSEYIEKFCPPATPQQPSSSTTTCTSTTESSNKE